MFRAHYHVILSTGDKEKSLCFREQKLVTYKGSGIKITLVSSKVTLKAGRQKNISKVLRRNDFQPKILYLRVRVE